MEVGAQLVAGCDVELAIGVAEVHFNCFDGNEESLGDLGIGGAGGGMFSDAALGGGQGGDAGLGVAAEAQA